MARQQQKWGGSLGEYGVSRGLMAREHPERPTFFVRVITRPRATMTGTLDTPIYTIHILACCISHCAYAFGDMVSKHYYGKISQRRNIFRLAKSTFSPGISHVTVQTVHNRKAALEFLLSPKGASIDVVLKEHEPPKSDAAHFLIMSSQNDPEEVIKCVTKGALDYLVKPLRQNELRLIWTRVWFWRNSYSYHINF
eukprot:gene10771-17858_t